LARFLADESVDFAVVRALRGAGLDVVAIAEVLPRATDAQVIDLAVREQRVLVTEDRDFGRFVYAHGLRTVGVIYIRYTARARNKLPGDVLEAVDRLGEKLRDRFVVLQPGRVRISGIPGSG